MLAVQTQKQTPRNGKLKTEAQKRVDRNTLILRHMPIPRPHGLAQMRKSGEMRKKKEKWKHRTGQLTPQERALAIAPVPRTGPPVPAGGSPAPVAYAKKCASKPPDGIKSLGPPVPAGGSPAPVAYAKKCASKLASSIKSRSPVQQRRVQAADKTAEPAPVVQTLPSGAPVPRYGGRKRSQWKAFDYGV